MAKSKSTRIEIVFSFDTTGSMYAALEEVRSKINEMTTLLMNDIPGLRIAIIAHGDYPQTSAEPYVTKRLDFTTSVSEITAFVNGVEKTYGADHEECYEVMLHEVQQFSWTEKYSHNLVVIGDAPPHPKGNKFNDIDWEQELDILVKDFSIRVYSVQCGSDPTSFYKTLADKSGGVLLPLTQFDKMKEIFLGLCYREATEFQYRNHEKQIIGLERSDSAQLLLPEELNLESHSLKNEDILSIHNSIHDPKLTSVTVNGVENEISVGEAGCRFVRVSGIVFIEQNKEKDTKYARMALEGKNITWICNTGRWGLVIDNSIVRR